MNASYLRIIDANLNRAREAFRVMEEYARFGLNDAELSAALKEARHALGADVPEVVAKLLLVHTPSFELTEEVFEE